MFKLFFFPLFIFIPLFFGCDDNGTTPIDENPATLLPLEIDNSWTYKLYDDQSNNNGEFVLTITEKIYINDLEYHIITTSGFGSDFIARNEDDGLFLAIYDSTKGFVSPHFFKFPAEDGETYEYQIPDTDSLLYITVAKQNLLINNQDYSCYGYISENLNPYSPFMYFAENTGLIRHKLFYITANTFDTTRYIAYDLQSKVLVE